MSSSSTQVSPTKPAKYSNVQDLACLGTSTNTNNADTNSTDPFCFSLKEEDVSKIPQKVKDEALKVLIKGGTADEALSVLEASHKHALALVNSLDNTDIWTHIFSFLGPGHFLFVALVCRKFKKNYMDYISKINHPKSVLVPPRTGIAGQSWRSFTSTDTYFRVAFATVPCAEFWKEVTKGEERHSVSWVPAKYGNLEVLKWTKQQGLEWDERTSTQAVKYGNLEIVKYLHENECPWEDGLYWWAAGSGNLELLKYVYEERLEPDFDLDEQSCVCSRAVMGGNWECLKYLHEKGFDWDHHTTDIAAQNGSLDCLKYAVEEGCDSGNACSWAAVCGQLECLKYLHEKDCHWDAGTCADAAINGHLECLKYAHEKGCEWSWTTCADAAGSGQLECLKYAHEEGCEWNATICEEAAKNGHLDCLKYAHASGCPWTEATCTAAAQGCHLDVLQWLYDHGCPMNAEQCLERPCSAWVNEIARAECVQWATADELAEFERRHAEVVEWVQQKMG